MLLPIAALLNGIGYVFIARIDTNLAGLQANWTFIGIAAYVLTLLLVRRVHDLARYKWTFAFVGVALLLLPFVPERRQDRQRLAHLGRASGRSTSSPASSPRSRWPCSSPPTWWSGASCWPWPRGASARCGCPSPATSGPVLIAWLASLVVLIGQKDLGSSLLFFTLFVVMLWIATERASYLAIGTVLFAVGAYAAWHARGHVRTRVSIWLEPVGRLARQGLPARAGRLRLRVGRRERHRPRPSATRPASPR